MSFCYIDSFNILDAIFFLVTLYYVVVAISLVHLIFKTDYNLTERLLWMVVLWVVPVIGLLAYWIFWIRRSKV